MALKFEILESALVVTDTDTSTITFDRPAKETWYQTRELDNDKIVLYDTSGVNSYASQNYETLLSTAVDSGLTPFTAETFRTFVHQNLGKSSPQGGGDFRVRVTQDNVANTLGGVIDSTKEYFIDGVINMFNVVITVPSTGISLTGYNFNLSKLVSDQKLTTMFVSDVGGSGDILPKDIAIEMTGSNSKVFDLTGASGFEAFEFARVNFNNCTSLGTINNYRQGFETGTGRFGGTPELTLDGTWDGGYFIDSSIVRGLTDGAYSLFKAGATFTMASRFRSNQNIDLPASASFFDFSNSNFTNPSTVQITGAIITRNGVFNSSDSNITPNMTSADLSSSWKGNQGISNTFEGGSIGVATELATTINTIGVFETLNAGSWSTLNLQHFDNPTGNQLRHLGNSPREYKVVADFTIDSGSNNDLTLRVRKWDNSSSLFETILDQRRQVNALVGSRDVAFFNININVTLDKDDYVEFQIANNTNTDNCTAELDSYYIVEER